METMEMKRKKLELQRVELARHELEFKIEEKMEEVNRIKSMVEIQKNKETELKAELLALGQKGE